MIIIDKNEALWETSCAIASLQGQIDSMNIEIGESPLLDRVYKKLVELETEIDKHLKKEGYNANT